MVDDCHRLRRPRRAARQPAAVAPVDLDAEDLYVMDEEGWEDQVGLEDQNLYVLDEDWDNNSGVVSILYIDK